MLMSRATAGYLLINFKAFSPRMACGLPLVAGGEKNSSVVFNFNSIQLQSSTLSHVIFYNCFQQLGGSNLYLCAVYLNVISTEVPSFYLLIFMHVVNADTGEQ